MIKKKDETWRRALIVFWSLLLLLVTGAVVFTFEALIELALFEPIERSVNRGLFKIWPSLLMDFLVLLLIWSWLSYWILLKLAKRPQSYSSMTFAKEENGYPYLVMGYSPYKNPADKQSYDRDLETFSPDQLAMLTSDYKALWEREFSGEEFVRNGWQQNLRLLAKQLKAKPELKAIYVLNPDIDQFDEFRDHLRKFIVRSGFEEDLVCIKMISQKSEPSKCFLPLDVEVTAPSYDSFEYVRQGLERAFEMIKEDHKETNFEPLTCIDATIGTKPFSMVVAMVTLNSSLRYSYVTNAGEVTFYDTNIDADRKPLSELV